MNKLILAFILLILFCGCGAVVDDAADFQGIVYDNETKLPIEKALINIKTFKGKNLNLSQLKSTYSNERGDYRIDVFFTTKYDIFFNNKTYTQYFEEATIEVSKEGYITQTYTEKRNSPEDSSHYYNKIFLKK